MHPRLPSCFFFRLWDCCIRHSCEHWRCAGAATDDDHFDFYVRPLPRSWHTTPGLRAQANQRARDAVTAAAEKVAADAARATYLEAWHTRSDAISAEHAAAREQCVTLAQKQVTLAAVRAVSSGFKREAIPIKNHDVQSLIRWIHVPCPGGFQTGARGELSLIAAASADGAVD